MYDQETIDRFWRFVYKTEDGHWIYGIPRNSKISWTYYRHFNFPNGGSIVSHRLTYELMRGAIPAGMILRHRCNLRGCCNPEHLMIGTHQENLWDSYARREYNIPDGVLFTYNDAPGWIPKGRRLREMFKSLAAYASPQEG